MTVTVTVTVTCCGVTAFTDRFIALGLLLLNNKLLFMFHRPLGHGHGLYRLTPETQDSAHD